MASSDASQSSESPNTQYPSQSSSFHGQHIWVSPEFQDSFDLYRWIVQSHGATLASQPNDPDTFHLLPKFQGETFNRLAESGRRIVAVPCLAASVRDGVPLPSVEDEAASGRYVPIFSRALEGQIVCTSHLNATFRKNIRTMVLLSNGQYQATLNANTTVLVTKRLESEKYLIAASSGIPIVTPAWIRDVFRQSKMLETQDYLLPCFSHLTFCCTGFEKTERDKLQRQIQSHGASWSLSLHKTCTHLIVDIDNPEYHSQKLKYAHKWKIKIVSQFWVSACILNGFYCPTDDTTAHLLKEAEGLEASISQSAASKNQTDWQVSAPSETPASNTAFPTPKDSVRFAGFTPMLKGQNSDLTSSELGIPSHHSESSSQLPSNSSNYIGHTPFRRVSVRQSHLDIRNSMSRSRLSSAPVEDEDGLEGDSPDDVDGDSEEDSDTHGAGSAIIEISQRLPSIDDQLPSDAEVEPKTLVNASNDAQSPEQLQERAIDEPPDASFPLASYQPIRSSAYDELDRNTQDALVTEALDIYFQPGVTSTNQTSSPLHRTAPSLVDNYFEGVVIAIVGVPDEDERSHWNQNTTKQMDDLEDAVDEFERRGGVLSLDVDDAQYIVVFDPKLLTQDECLEINSKVVVSYEWLTDSVLLQFLQPIENFALAYNESSQMFLPRINKFWTSSCVVSSVSEMPAISPAPINVNAHSEVIITKDVSVTEKLQNATPLKPTTPVATPMSRNALMESSKAKKTIEIKEVDVDGEETKKYVPIHQRNILPPTTISASHLLLQSALHVKTLRKLDKQRVQEAKRERTSKGTLDHKKRPPSPSRMSDAKGKATKTKRSSDGNGHVVSSKHSTKKDMPPPIGLPEPRLPNRHHHNSKNHHHATFDAVGADMMDVDDIREGKSLRRKVGLDLIDNPRKHHNEDAKVHSHHIRRHSEHKTGHVEKSRFDSDSDDDDPTGYRDDDSIISSPLTVHAKMMQGQKKRKRDNRCPILDVDGVFKRKPVVVHDLVEEDVHQVAEEDKAKDGELEKLQEDEPKATGEERFEFSPPLADYSSSLESPPLDMAAKETNKFFGSAQFLTQPGRSHGLSSSPVELPRDQPFNEMGKRRELHESQNPSSPLYPSSPPYPPSPPYSSSPGHSSGTSSAHPTPQSEPSYTPVKIIHVDTTQGSMTGGDSVIVTLDRIEPTMKVVFGQVVAETIPHPTQPKLWATSPPSAVPLTVQLSILDKGRRINQESDQVFMYT